ncbi:MAG: hypothetical protein BWY61_00687 [Firmicutes bacterium ADurb.Bin354]|nr:MAG: hypothetical protein BWY61_00687 [Firmicutes bacterium ADurb.Bin354]
MSVFLTVLKITGIVLGSLLGFILLLILLLLFYPFHFRIIANKHEEFAAKAKVFWLWHIISVTVDYRKELKTYIKVFGIDIYDLKKRKEQKEKEKEEKNSQKKSGKKSRNDSDEVLTSEEADELRKEKSKNEISGKSSAETVKKSEAEKDDRKSGKRGKRKRRKKITFWQFLDRLEDKLFDFIIDLPDKVAAFWDNITGKIEEFIEKIDYYDRLLGSKGADEVIKMTKYRVGKVLKPLIPKKIMCSLDYSDDDPEKVAKMWQYYALSIPLRDGIPGYFDMNAVQGEKNVELDLTVKGYFFLGPILWHTAMLVLNKKFKSFIKRLKREES